MGRPWAVGILADKAEGRRRTHRCGWNWTGCCKTSAPFREHCFGAIFHGRVAASRLAMSLIRVTCAIWRMRSLNCALPSLIAGQTRNGITNSTCAFPARSHILGVGDGGCIAPRPIAASASYIVRQAETFLPAGRHGGWATTRNGSPAATRRSKHSLGSRGSWAAMKAGRCPFAAPRACGSGRSIGIGSVFCNWTLSAQSK